MSNLTITTLLEYAAILSGVKVILVLGHKHCGAVNASLNLLSQRADVAASTGCPNLPIIVEGIQPNVTDDECRKYLQLDEAGRDSFADEVAKRNVLHVVGQIKLRSQPIRQAVEEERLLVVAAMYDVDDGSVEFLGELADNQ